MDIDKHIAALTELRETREQLTDRTRAAVEAAHADGMSGAQIAAHLGISRQAVNRIYLPKRKRGATGVAMALIVTGLLFTLAASTAHADNPIDTIDPPFKPDLSHMTTQDLHESIHGIFDSYAGAVGGKVVIGKCVRKTKRSYICVIRVTGKYSERLRVALTGPYYSYTDDQYYSELSARKLPPL